MVRMPGGWSDEVISDRLICGRSKCSSTERAAAISLPPWGMTDEKLVLEEFGVALYSCAFVQTARFVHDVTAAAWHFRKQGSNTQYRMGMMLQQ